MPRMGEAEVNEEAVVTRAEAEAQAEAITTSWTHHNRAMLQLAEAAATQAEVVPTQAEEGKTSRPKNLSVAAVDTVRVAMRTRIN